jgi:uncharacterized protein (TIGR02453 family)
MSYFTKDFNQFFIELAANNHKDWFDQNRKRYETSVKKPFENFVSELLAALKEEDPSIDIDPKKCIFRINRDIRFSKDKTPYKLNRSANMSKGGKSDGATPGLYIQIGPESVDIAGGAYQPDKEQLAQIREFIIEKPKDFRKAIEDKDFVNVFGELKGDANKRLPSKEMMEAAQSEPMLFRKQFYYWASFDPENVENPDLVEFIMDKHRAAKPVREFLTKALNS